LSWNWEIALFWICRRTSFQFIRRKKTSAPSQ
jgi:hypothetical protein